MKSDKTYKLISKNKTLAMRYPDTTENIAYVSYRFVRVLNKRLVLGITDQAIVTLGAEGKLCEFRSFEPEYEPISTNTRAVKPDAFEKILKKQVKDKVLLKTDVNMEKIDFEQIDVDDITDAYYQITESNNKVIVPHVAVLMSYKGKSGKKSREMLLSLRSQDWSNLSDTDVEIRKNSSK